MAIVHEIAYSSDSIDKINMLTYVKSLVTDLICDNPNIIFHSEIDSICLLLDEVKT